MSGDINVAETVQSYEGVPTQAHAVLRRQETLHEVEWPVGYIKVGDRVRQDLGDIDAMVASIEDVGLLQPIVVDRELNLVAGQRRLEAIKRLGWSKVRVSVAENVVDAATALRAERDENQCRKSMTPSEQVALTDRLIELERPAASDRRREGNAIGGRGGHDEVAVSGDTATSEDLSNPNRSEQNKVRNIAGTAAGWSGPSYQRAKGVLNAAKDGSLPEDVRKLARNIAGKMDRGEVTVTGAYREIQKAKKAAARAASKEPSLHTQDGTKRNLGKTWQAIREREETVRRMANEGYTSRQIAAEIGVTRPDAVKGIAKRIGVEITADRIVARTRHIDSTRVVEQAVLSAENVTAGVDLIDYSELDPERLDEWVSSLDRAIRDLQSFKRRLTKELTNG